MAAPVVLAAASARGASTWALLLTRARGKHAGSKASSWWALVLLGRVLATWWRRDRLKRCLALSVAEHGNGAGAPPQHAWAASLLDACKLQQIRSRRSCSSSENSNSDSDSAGGGELSSPCCENEAEETFRDWGTPYEDVDRLLGAPARGVTPGALKATGRSCRWCSHQIAVGDCV